MNWWDRLMARVGSGPAEPEEVNPDLTEVKRETELLKAEADRVVRQRRLGLEVKARRVSR